MLVQRSTALQLTLFVLIVGFIWSFWPAGPLIQQLRLQQPDQSCSLDAEILDGLRLTAPISYGRIDFPISYSFAAHKRPSDGPTLDISLPQLHSLDDHGRATAQTSAGCVVSKSLTMPKPPTARPDASSIVFGVATTIERLDESLKVWAYWAAHTGTSILALIEPTTPEEITRVQKAALNLGYNLQITTSDAKFTDRYFALTRHLNKNRLGKTQWAVFIDDDTFFPSMHAVLEVLGKYDASKPQYIGGMSEDFKQVTRFGIFAFGGGGIFLSVPLLEQVDAHFDECAGTDDGGDLQIANCIQNHTPTKLSWEPRFHQTDLRDDVSGFYESGRGLPLSLHHWKSWNKVDVLALTAVSRICGDACMLRKWKLKDGWFFTNGFSFVKYSDDRPADDPVMEETWSDGGDYRHSLFPVRKKDDGKLSYRLEKVVGTPYSARQFYVKRETGGDKVIEVAWRVR